MTAKALRDSLFRFAEEAKVCPAGRMTENHLQRKLMRLREKVYYFD
jgi:hypothetical protein